MTMTNCEMGRSQRLRLIAQTPRETAHLYTTIAQNEVNPAGMRPEIRAISLRYEKSFDHNLTISFYFNRLERCTVTGAKPRALRRPGSVM